MLYQTPVYLPFVVLAWVLYWRFCKTPTVRATCIAIASMAFLVLAQLERTSWQQAAVSITAAGLLSLAVFKVGRHLTRNPAQRVLWLGIFIPLTPLLGFKYLSPILESIDLLPEIIVPLGISYYTFKHIHYLVECSRGQFQDVSISEYLAYIFFFPMFIAGPIERLNRFAEQNRAIRFDQADLSLGLERILIGMAKKFLVADLLLQSFLPPPEVIEGGLLSLQWHQLVFACFIKFLITYFDFSGYTDMVLGTARLFGFQLMENFNFPWLRANLAEFWRAWHISLSSWARDYVYLPILAHYRSTTLALLATMLTIGVWHGPYAGWALWGLHHGLGLIALAEFQRWAMSRPRLQSLRATNGWRIFATLATLFYVSVGYALTFNADEPWVAGALYLKIMTLGLVP